MPELPEVQTVVNDLQSLVGAEIESAELFWSKSAATADFCQQISQQVIQKIHREGKFICIKLTKHYLLIHLRMSGRLLLADTPSHHERVRFYLKDGRILKFIDQRKFGRLYLVEELKLNLGVDPFAPKFNPNCFSKAGNKKIKTALLDQTIIAGIGNIYADEALWEARIHPEQLTNQLTQKEKTALCQAILKVLRLAIEHRGTSLGHHESNFHSSTGQRGANSPHLKVYHQTGKPCLRCSTAIGKMRLNGRSTHFCPKCQVS